MPGQLKPDSPGCVWAYRQACQDERNVERLGTWQWRKKQRRLISIIYRGASRWKPTPGQMKRQHEAMRPHVTPADVERLVRGDEKGG